MLEKVTKINKYGIRNQDKINEKTLVLTTADSDFKPPKYILNNILKVIKDGDFSYNRGEEILSKNIINYLINYKKYADLKRDNLFYTMSAINILQIAILFHTNENESVLILDPIYPPFIKILKKLKRRIVTLTLRKGGINYKELQEKIFSNNIKLFLFCNPHNPSAYIFSKKELLKIKNILYKNECFIYSDEVWSDLVWNREFTSFSNLDKSEDSKIVSINGLGKTFNLHALNFAYGVSHNKKLISNLKETSKTFFSSSHKNVSLLAAIDVAYNGIDMDDWINNYIKLIQNNYIELKNNLKETKIVVPNIKSTYVLFLDFTKISLSHQEIKKKLLEENLILSDGEEFGEMGIKHFRINLSTTEKNIKDAIRKIKNIKEFC